eukprot:9494463-Pyramimonas_sp.AAC.2
MVFPPWGLFGSASWKLRGASGRLLDLSRGNPAQLGAILTQRLSWRPLRGILALLEAGSKAISEADLRGGGLAGASLGHLSAEDPQGRPRARELDHSETVTRTFSTPLDSTPLGRRIWRAKGRGACIVKLLTASSAASYMMSRARLTPCRCESGQPKSSTFAQCGSWPRRCCAAMSGLQLSPGCLMTRRTHASAIELRHICPTTAAGGSGLGSTVGLVRHGGTSPTSPTSLRTPRRRTDVGLDP